MSIAEHVSVFISIIFGIAVGDLLMSLHRLLRASRRVKWHWLPLAVASFMLLLTVSFWWLTFSWYQQVERLTVAHFLPTLAQFVVLFLLVAASLPDEVPAEGLDLRQWYFENSRLYWTLAAISLFLDIVVGGVRELDPGEGVLELLQAKANDLIFFPFLIAMIFVRRFWYHAAFVIVSLANMWWLAVSVALNP